MRIILNDEGVIFEAGNNIVFAKHNPLTGGLGVCTKEEATHLWNLDTNTAYMADTPMLELNEVPEEVVPFEYKYIEGEFIKNEPEITILEE